MIFDLDTSFKKIVISLCLMVISTMGVVAYIAIGNIATEQSKLQVQFLLSVFSLWDNEILRPLYVAQTLESGQFLHQLIESEQADQDKIYDFLAELERNFALACFVASEKHCHQYFSERASIELIEGQKLWYFDAAKSPKKCWPTLSFVRMRSFSCFSS